MPVRTSLRFVEPLPGSCLAIPRLPWSSLGATLPSPAPYGPHALPTMGSPPLGWGAEGALEDPGDGRYRRLDIGGGRDRVGDRDAHEVPPLPDGPAHPAGAFPLDRVDDAVRPGRRPEVDEHLVEHYLVGDGD